MDIKIIKTSGDSIVSQDIILTKQTTKKTFVITWTD